MILNMQRLSTRRLYRNFSDIDLTTFDFPLHQETAGAGDSVFASDLSALGF